MRILVTGGTGFIGRALCARLLADGHEVLVLSRDPQTVGARTGLRGVEAIRSLDRLAGGDPVDVIFNLAGEPIADGRWTASRRRLLRDSRIGVAAALVDLVARMRRPPEVMVSGSAIGYYGDAGERILDESAAPGRGFAAELCRDWEAEAARVRDAGVRLHCVRTGIVLHPSGGALRRMLLPFRVGMGGAAGDGRQWMSWIHRDDLVEFLLFLMRAPAAAGDGAWNGTAPEPVTAGAFAVALGRAMGKPSRMSLPSAFLRLGLGEAAGLLLDSQRVVPRRALDAGFVFRYPDVAMALDELRRT